MSENLKTSEVKEYENEKRKALIENDPRTLRAVINTDDPVARVPEDDEKVLIGIHKSIALDGTMPYLSRRKSNAWLAERNLTIYFDSDEWIP